MVQKYKKRRILFFVAFFWELFRTGILWRINQNMLLKAYAGLSVFYLLWLIVPVLTLFAGYLMVIVEPKAYRICILLLMNRAFQVVIGLISLLILLIEFHSTILIPYLYQISLLIFGDIIFMIIQFIDVRYGNLQQENIDA